MGLGIGLGQVPPRGDGLGDGRGRGGLDARAFGGHKTEAGGAERRTKLAIGRQA